MAQQDGHVADLEAIKIHHNTMETSVYGDQFQLCKLEPCDVGSDKWWTAPAFHPLDAGMSTWKRKARSEADDEAESKKKGKGKAKKGKGKADGKGKSKVTATAMDAPAQRRKVRTLSLLHRI